MAERTERVYDYVSEKPTPDLISRLKSTASWGSHVGLWALFYTVIECMVLFVTEMLFPVVDIDILQSFDKETYCKDPLAYGDHKVCLSSLQSIKVPASTSKKTEDGEVPVHVTKVIDLYHEPEEIVEIPTKFNRKRRYELVKPCMNQLKHELSRKKRRQIKKKISSFVEEESLSCSSLDFN